MYTGVVTKLSLREFSQEIGIHPLHLGGLIYNPEGRTVFCEAPYFQFPYQDHDRVSRLEIAQAVKQAETMLETWLGYRLLPAWENQEFHSLAGGVPGDVGLKVDWGHAIAGGCRGAELLGDNVAIAWSDEDGDGYEETGTVVVNGLTDQLPNGACEVRIFVPGKEAAEQYEVKPIREAVFSAGTLTVKFWRETAVLQVKYEALNATGIPYDDDASFETALDVYRIFNDRTCAQQLLWSNPAGGCIAGPDYSSWNEQDAQLIVRDQRLGWVRLSPASYSDTDLVWSSAGWFSPWPVQAVNLYYYAGFQDKGQQCAARQMDERWKNAVSQLAASMLDRPPCDCTADQWHYYREDLAQAEGSEDFGTFREMREYLPFGTRRGAVNAYRRVKDPGVALGRGVASR